MYETAQYIVLDKTQDAKASAYTGICFHFFFPVKGKLHVFGERLFFIRWNEQQKVSTSLWIGVCLICHAGTLMRLFNDFHFVIHEAHFSENCLLYSMKVFNTASSMK